MRGRKPLPTTLKQIQGTLRKHRVNQNEAKPETEMPEMPAHLSPFAVELWQETTPKLHALGLLTKIDGSMLALLCESYSIYRGAQEIVHKEGMVIEITNSSGDTIQKQHAALKIQMQASEQLTKLLCEFGMSPSSRSRVSIAEPPAKPNPFKQLLSSRRENHVE